MSTDTDTDFHISTRRCLTDDMAVDVPEGEHGACRVEKFEIGRHDIQNVTEGARSAFPGMYTKLTRGGTLWMSDTTAERRDHIMPAIEIDRRGGRMLIGGLGLGMILRVALLTPSVTHVDVIEINEDVIALVGPHYEQMAAENDVELVVHHADMYEIKWEKGTRWNVGWFDIWPDLCEDNLVEMGRLGRSYGRRCNWTGYWGKELLQAERRRTANAPWRW